MASPGIDLSRVGVAEYQGPNEGRRIGSLAAVHGTHWGVWVEFSRGPIVAPARAFLTRTVILASIFLSTAMFLAIALTARITTPLRGLVRASAKIAAGDYSERVVTGRRDEIGWVGDAFNSMAERVEHVHLALTAAHERTQLALSAARAGIWEQHIQSGALTWSVPMTAALGLTADEAPGSEAAFYELVHPDDRDSLRRALAHAIEHRADAVTEFRSTGADGQIHWVALRARPVFAPDGSPAIIVGVGLDITERKLLEQQFRHAQKMEAVGQLAGGIAHDFNNLLTAILGYGAIAARGTRSPSDPLRTDTLEILRAGERGAALTRQLLAFSRRQVLQLEAVSLNAVVAETEKLLRRLLGENITLVTGLQPGISSVRVDPGQIEQVLVNLAVNARDAMPAGGTLDDRDGRRGGG